MAENTSEADAAMAAMGLPSNFAAPAFPRGAGRGARPPIQSARGRDGGWSGRGRGRGQGAGPSSFNSGPPSHVPTGPAAMRGGGHFQSFGNTSRGDNKRKRGGSNFQPRNMPERPLPNLEDVRE